MSPSGLWAAALAAWTALQALTTATSQAVGGTGATPPNNPLTYGSTLILRIGDGSSSPVPGAVMGTVIDEYLLPLTPAGNATLLQSLTLPSTCTLVPNNTAQGAMTLAADLSHVVFACFADTEGSVPTATVVGRLLPTGSSPPLISIGEATGSNGTGSFPAGVAAINASLVYVVLSGGASEGGRPESDGLWAWTPGTGFVHTAAGEFPAADYGNFGAMLPSFSASTAAPTGLYMAYTGETTGTCIGCGSPTTMEGVVFFHGTPGLGGSSFDPFDASQFAALGVRLSTPRGFVFAPAATVPPAPGSHSTATPSLLWALDLDAGLFRFQLTAAGGWQQAGPFAVPGEGNYFGIALSPDGAVAYVSAAKGLYAFSTATQTWFSALPIVLPAGSGGSSSAVFRGLAPSPVLPPTATATTSPQPAQVTSTVPGAHLYTVPQQAVLATLLALVLAYGIACSVCFLWFYAARPAPIILESQPSLSLLLGAGLHLTLVAVALSLASPTEMFATVDPTTAASRVFIAQAYLQSLAFWAVVGVLLAKAYRVFMLVIGSIINPKLRKVSMSVFMLHAMIGAAIVLELALDTAWAMVDPPVPLPVMEPTDPSVTQLIATYRSPVPFLLWIVSKSCCLALLCLTAWVTRSVKSNRGEYVGVMRAVWLVALAGLVLPAVYYGLCPTDPRTAAFCVALGSTLMVAALLSALFLPRLRLAYTEVYTPHLLQPQHQDPKKAVRVSHWAASTEYGGEDGLIRDTVNSGIYRLNVNSSHGSSFAQLSRSGSDGSDRARVKGSRASRKGAQEPVPVVPLLTLGSSKTLEVMLSSAGTEQQRNEREQASQGTRPKRRPSTEANGSSAHSSSIIYYGSRGIRQDPQQQEPAAGMSLIGVEWSLGTVGVRATAAQPSDPASFADLPTAVESPLGAGANSSGRDHGASSHLPQSHGHRTNALSPSIESPLPGSPQGIPGGAESDSSSRRCGNDHRLRFARLQQHPPVTAISTTTDAPTRLCPIEDFSPSARDSGRACEHIGVAATDRDGRESSDPCALPHHIRNPDEERPESHSMLSRSLDYSPISTVPTTARSSVAIPTDR